MRSGFVSIVGRPNVGKSTLLNSLLERKIAITSDKVGTTRNIIEGIYHDDDSEIIFIDTPGIHKPSHKLGSVLNKKAYTSMNEVDIILFLIDAQTGFGRNDEFILSRLKEENKCVFLILNKVDKLKKESLLELIDFMSKQYDFKEIIPISALKGDNIDDLLQTLKKYLPHDQAFFDEEQVTNISTHFMLGEIVREKILQLTKDEVPHSVSCFIENMEEEDNIFYIQALIVVDRDNLKKIIIGKQGQLLKEVGIRARADMEELLGKKVHLTTYVKTLKNWRDEEKYLIELGIKDS